MFRQRCSTEEIYKDKLVIHKYTCKLNLSTLMYNFCSVLYMYIFKKRNHVYFRSTIYAAILDKKHRF